MRRLAWGRQKPPLGADINRGHPLAQGLVAAFVMNEGAGAPHDLVRRTRADTLPTGTAPGWTASTGGVALRGNGTDAARTASAPVTTYPFTISCRNYLSQLPAGVNYVPVCLSPAASTEFAEIIYPAGDPLKYRIKGGTATVELSLGTPVALTEYAVTVRSASSTDHAAWKDMTKATSTTDAGTVAFETLVLLGELFNGNLFNAHAGGVFSAYVWSRALPDDQILWLHREPYAMFTASARRAVKRAAVAGGSILRQMLMHGKYASEHDAA